MDQVDEVKAKVDIVSIIGERVELKKAGRNFKGLCPFHSEKSPSFIVSPELQIFKCFGCGESGDVFTFLEKYEGMDFTESLQTLAERVGVTLKPFKGGSFDYKQTLFEINRETSKFYNYILTSHPLGKAALAYLTRDRGISETSIKEFKLGYSPENPGILRSFLLDKRKYKLGDVEKAGIKGLGGSFYDRFRGRVIFPIFDHRGNTIAFAGRLMPNKPGEMAKYINSPETPVYIKGQVLYGLNLTREYIKRAGVAIIVEGELDLISSWQVGIKNVVAIKGSALTPEQIKLLSRFCRKVILTLDADAAGSEATKRGIKVAILEGLEIKVARLSGFKDPDEAARRNPKGYKKALEDAVNVWDFLIDSTFDKYDSKTGQGKAQISREVTPILASIEDKIVQEYYTSVVAQKLGVTSDAVFEQTKTKEKAYAEPDNTQSIFKTEPKNRRVLLEERLLSLVFSHEPSTILDKTYANLFQTPLASRIFSHFKEYYSKQKSFDPSGFASVLPKELTKGFSEMILLDFDDDVDKEMEIETLNLELRSLELKRKLEEIGVRIRKYEEEGDLEKLKKEQVNFSEITRKLSKLEQGENRRSLSFS